MFENNVSVPGVSEMIRQLLLENIYTVARCLQERFMGQNGGSKLIEDCEIGVLTETRCEATEGD